MDVKRIALFALVGLLAVGAAGGTAHAEGRDHKQDGRDTAALAGMKVTLAQAIVTAEQQAGGRAVGADLLQEKGVTRIAVEVAGAQGVRTVIVDAQTDQVTAANTGSQDSEDNEDND
jgi:uncharacterized membrane protein YkoI